MTERDETGGPVDPEPEAVAASAATTNLDWVGNPASAANANTAGADHAPPDPANVWGHRTSPLRGRGGTRPRDKNATRREVIFARRRARGPTRPQREAPC